VSIDCAVFGAVNEPFVSVTFCSPSDATNCLTVDHILVDTGSTGLRVFAEPSTTAALSTLGLATLTTTSSGGNPIGECQEFVQGNTWGPVKLANIAIGGETASNVAIQVINDTSFSAVPSACSTSGSILTSPTGFGANGVLGIGITLQDCGSTCVSSGANIYFGCPASGCTNIGMPLTSQVQNPVSLFSSGNNNGVILSLNSIPSNGAATTGGTLTFGIDTAANNVSANTNTIIVDANYGIFTTTFEGGTYNNSYIDSGSNGLYFNPASNEAITQCTGSSAGFYCPSSTISGLSAQLAGLTGSTATATVSFSVANAVSLFATDNAAFTALGGTATDVAGIGQTFDWGIPFFYGNNVYVAFDGATTSKGTGPYFGF
jgi:hypothetical protein